jgi:hypothetical protein
MKTIQVSDEMYAQLMELSKEMNIQDKRATAEPYFFQIQTKKKIYVPDGCGNECWVNDDNEIETEEGINDTIFQYEDEAIPIENIQSMKDYEKEEILERAGWRKVNYQFEDQYENAFFTSKACKDHIEKNHYHYHKPIDYLTHAFRNPEMELIFKFLSSLTDKK